MKGLTSIPEIFLQGKTNDFFFFKRPLRSNKERVRIIVACVFEKYIHIYAMTDRGEKKDRAAVRRNRKYM